jgi:hypothetical protein
MSFNLAEALEAESVPVNEATRGTKFGKSSSLSSVRTASEGYLEQETLCRKISLSQKERFIQLITEENFNMKEVTMTSSRPQNKLGSATAQPKRSMPVFGTSSENGSFACPRCLSRRLEALFTAFRSRWVFSSEEWR